LAKGKDANGMECSNYRGVSLVHTTYKTLSNILFARISPFVENMIGNLSVWCPEE
jgi:hypothetical protein